MNTQDQERFNHEEQDVSGEVELRLEELEQVVGGVSFNPTFDDRAIVDPLQEKTYRKWFLPKRLAPNRQALR